MKYRRYTLSIFKLNCETWRQCALRYVKQNSIPRRDQRAFAYCAVGEFDRLRARGVGPRIAAIRAILSQVDLFVRAEK